MLGWLDQRSPFQSPDSAKNVTFETPHGYGHFFFLKIIFKGYRFTKINRWYETHYQ